ncbi:MAG: methylated-DNA--[protein]-cysteine S-methyltransferase [Patescibacteria group bacterium]
MSFVHPQFGTLIVELGNNSEALSILFGKSRSGSDSYTDSDHKLTDCLEDYFNGERPDFSQFVSFTDKSSFVRAVLNAVCAIPYGKTASYADIAKAVGRPKAVRAVASAIAKNKILIAIPCHRVVRSDGKIGKYRAGTAIKQKLLEHEANSSKN